tara:strand:- start:537 stop:1499 length:963 start_codon:yes stop_codon:yes gene_type:complete
MSFKSLFKTIIKTSSITSLGISSLVAFTSPSKAENFNMKACPEPGSANATLAYIQTTLGGECLHTPDQYKLTIYEMGLCQTDPISTGVFLKDANGCVQTMLSTSGTEVDLAPGSSSEKTAALPSASSRPANGSYPHAYILLSNGFKMKGSYQLFDPTGNNNGDTYYSKEATDAYGTFGAADKTLSAAAEHTDLVDNMYFGDDENGWDGVMSATAMPGTGTVSALLLKDCVNDTCVGASAVASSQGEVKRLLGVFSNTGSPVEILDSTNGIEVQLIVKADPSNPENSGGGYLLIGWDQGDGNGFDLRMFGSAPFKPKFTTF